MQMVCEFGYCCIPNGGCNYYYNCPYKTERDRNQRIAYPDRYKEKERKEREIKKER